MKKIKILNLQRLRNNEHFEFMRHIQNIVAAAGAENLRVAPQTTAHAAALADEDTALKKITKSALTARIAEADAARDEAFEGLLNSVRAARVHFLPAAREAAVSLGIIMDTYGNVARLAIEEESSAVYNLCRDLTTRHADACETLGLMPWITELNTRNRAVQTLIESRYEEGAAQTPLVMKQARGVVDEAYGALADMFFAQGMVASLGTDATLSATFESVAGQWNEIIDRTDGLVTARRARAAAKKAREEAAANGGGEGGSGSGDGEGGEEPTPQPAPDAPQE